MLHMHVATRKRRESTMLCQQSRLPQSFAITRPSEEIAGMPGLHALILMLQWYAVTGRRCVSSGRCCSEDPVLLVVEGVSGHFVFRFAQHEYQLPRPICCATKYIVSNSVETIL